MSFDTHAAVGSTHLVSKTPWTRVWVRAHPDGAEGLGWAREEGPRWWVAFDDGRAYSVQRFFIHTKPTEEDDHGH